MNNDRFKEIVDKTIADTGALLVKKNAEYAGTADVLANFKRNAERNGQTVLECWQTYWNKHIDAIHSYMLRVKDHAVRMALQDIAYEARTAEKEQNLEILQAAVDPVRFRQRVDAMVPLAIKDINGSLSEPIEGRFDDNINYSILCKAILEELSPPLGATGVSGHGCDPGRIN